MMGAFECTLDADLGQRRCDALRAGLTPGPELLQAGDDLGAQRSMAKPTICTLSWRRAPKSPPRAQADPQLSRRPRGVDPEPTQLIVIGDAAVPRRSPAHAAPRRLDRVAVGQTEWQ